MFNSLKSVIFTGILGTSDDHYSIHRIIVPPIYIVTKTDKFDKTTKYESTYKYNPDDKSFKSLEKSYRSDFVSHPNLKKCIDASLKDFEKKSSFDEKTLVIRSGLFTGIFNIESNKSDDIVIVDIDCNAYSGIFRQIAK